MYSVGCVKDKKMYKEKVSGTEIQCIGLKCRTNNLAEKDPITAKIGQTAQRYFQEIYPNFSKKKNLLTTYAVYTEYESDASGDYTYCIGTPMSEDLRHRISTKDVSRLTPQLNLKEYSTLIIPQQTYIKFTTKAGKMPEVCINA